MDAYPKPELPLNSGFNDGLNDGLNSRPNKADLALLGASSARGIGRLLAAQAVLGGLGVFVSWAVGGGVAAVSAMIGAAAYFVPNAFFALRLLAGFLGQKKPNPFGVFLGEALKLGSAVMLMALAAYFGRAWLVWPAFLFGLLCVLKGYVLLIIFRKRLQRY